MRGLPEILARRETDGGCELDLEVPPSNHWFEGHFPAMAILPGVVQLGWAAHYAREMQGYGPEVTTLEQVKFKRPIQPGARLTLLLKADPVKRKVRYEYRDGETVCSSGVLDFGVHP